MRHVALAERRLRNALVRGRLSLAPNPPPLDRDRALATAAAADHILFLCLGNICRSPLAERYARRLLQAAGEDVEVDSAGFVAREGRRSPPDAVAAAARHGVDLSDHRSRRVRRAGVEASDVVFLMDVRNYRDFGRTFDPVDVEVYFLGSLADTSDGFEIADPAGEGPDAFDSSFADVTAAVDALVYEVVERTA